jgi:hypothetical protein
MDSIETNASHLSVSDRIHPVNPVLSLLWLRLPRWD